jgi:hypothetical protein
VLSSFIAVPPAGTVGAESISGPFDGISLSQDHQSIYVVGNNNNRVMRYSTAGTFLDAFAINTPGGTPEFINVVPEPSALWLMGLSAATFMSRRRRA